MRICQTDLLFQQPVPVTNCRSTGATTIVTNPLQLSRRMQSVQSSLIASSNATALAVQYEPLHVLNHHDYDTMIPDMVLNQTNSTQRCHTSTSTRTENELLRVAILHQQEIERVRAATLSTIRPIWSGVVNGNGSNQIHLLHERDMVLGHPREQYRYLIPTIDTRWSSRSPNPTPEEVSAIQQIRRSMIHNQPTSIPYPTISTNSGRVKTACPQTAPINSFGRERIPTNVLSHGAQSIVINRSLLHATDDSNLTLNFNMTTIPVGAVPQQEQQQQQLSSITTRLVLPSCVAQPIDVYKISAHQCLLREQMEYFAATESDVQIHVRGRNKAITIGQVGIRCKHCAHVPISKRQKGSTYFPSNKLGIYQAAQNMSTTHIQCGLCTCTPDSIKDQFVTIMTDRQRNENGAGRPYWAQSATQIGLINTAEHGIRFRLDPHLPPEICVVPD